MTSPIKPKKKIVITDSKTYYFNHVSKETSLQYFFDWCKRYVPKGAKDIKLSLKEEFVYDDHFSYLELSWKIKKNNPHYEKQLKKYNKDLKKWKEQNK